MIVYDGPSTIGIHHSSNTINAVCPPPEVTFNSDDADKRINAPSTSF